MEFKKSRCVLLLGKGRDVNHEERERMGTRLVCGAEKVTGGKR
jgi:hypothetical protein